MKIYDARTGGGFAFVAPPPGCVAADECHGAGSSAPAGLPIGTRAGLAASGNLSTGKKAHKKKNRAKKRHKRHKRHQRQKKAQRGGRRNG